MYCQTWCSSWRPIIVLLYIFCILATLFCLPSTNFTQGWSDFWRGCKLNCNACKTWAMLNVWFVNVCFVLLLNWCAIHYNYTLYIGSSSSEHGESSNKSVIYYPVDRLATTDNNSTAAVPESSDSPSASGADNSDNTNLVLRCQFCKRHVSISILFRGILQF